MDLYHSLYEISDIVNEFRDKYENSEIDFGVPIVEEVDELIIDIFYEATALFPKIVAKEPQKIYF